MPDKSVGATTPPTPNVIRPVNAGHQCFVGGRSAIDDFGYLGRPPDKVRWSSFPRPARGCLGGESTSNGEHLRCRRTSYVVGLSRRLARVPRQRRSGTVSTSTAQRRAARAGRRTPTHRCGSQHAFPLLISREWWIHVVIHEEPYSPSITTRRAPAAVAMLASSRRILFAAPPHRYVL